MKDYNLKELEDLFAKVFHIEELEPPEVLEVRHMRLDKDGTRYEMMAIKLKGDFKFGTLGAVTDGWLVISHLDRKAYLFQPAGILDSLYVASKLQRHDRMSTKDADNMKTLLSALIQRP